MKQANIVSHIVSCIVLLALSRDIRGCQRYSEPQSPIRWMSLWPLERARTVLIASLSSAVRRSLNVRALSARCSVTPNRAPISTFTNPRRRRDAFKSDWHPKAFKINQWESVRDVRVNISGPESRNEKTRHVDPMDIMDRRYPRVLCVILQKKSKQTKRENRDC